MKNKFVILTLLSCLLFCQVPTIPVYAAVTNPTASGGSDGAGGGGGYTGGKAGTYIPAKYETKKDILQIHIQIGIMAIIMYLSVVQDLIGALQAMMDSTIKLEQVRVVLLQLMAKPGYYQKVYF